jgi:pimeloyl-ACP methyl ester carboxylesterase
LIGLSFGGVVAQAMMVAYPDLVDRVLLSGTSTRLNRLLIDLQRLNEPIMKMLSPKQLAELVAKQFGIPSEYLPSMSADFESFSVKSFFAVMQCYGDIVMPSMSNSSTLICVGSRETGIAKSMAKKLGKGIPHSKRLVIQGGSHVWNMQMPDLFCEVTRSWLEDKDLPAGVSFE